MASNRTSKKANSANLNYNISGFLPAINTFIMPQVSRNGDLCFTGHPCTRVAPVMATQFTVFINGIPSLKQADPVAPHLIKSGIICIPHSAFVNRGSSSVFVRGIPIARVGDSTDFGGLFRGSNNVFAGG